MRKRFGIGAFVGLLLFALAGPVLTAAASAQGPAVTRDFLIGRWTDTNDCTNAVDFRRDGTFLTTEGAAGRWTLEGGRISFIGQSTISARISASDANSISLNHDDGTVGRSTRCGTARRVTMPTIPATAEEVLRISRPAEAALLVGTWTDNGDCGSTITFHSDGRFVVPTGGGRWTLVGEQLSFIGQSTVSARVRAVGNNRILLIHPNGTLGQSMRC